MEYARQNSEIYWTFDMIWLLLFTFSSNILAPIFIILLAPAFSNLTDISLRQDLKLFRASILAKNLIISLIMILGYSLVFYGHYLAIDPYMSEFGTFKSYTLVIGLIATSIYSSGLYGLPNFMLLVWINHIRTTFESNDSRNILYRL